MKPRRLAALTLGLAVVAAGLSGPAAAQASPYDRTLIGVDSGTGSCTVSWLRDYWAGTVVTYKIWVVPQDNAPNASPIYRKITRTPQKPGMRQSFRVGSLRRGAGYVFWLEALYRSYLHGGLVSVQEGTSAACVPR